MSSCSAECETAAERNLTIYQHPSDYGIQCPVVTDCLYMEGQCRTETTQCGIPSGTYVIREYQTDFYLDTSHVDAALPEADRYLVSEEGDGHDSRQKWIVTCIGGSVYQVTQKANLLALEGVHTKAHADHSASISQKWIINAVVNQSDGTHTTYVEDAYFMRDHVAMNYLTG